MDEIQFKVLTLSDIDNIYGYRQKNGAIMIREVDLAFIKIHILYHAAKDEVYGVGLIEELARHGYGLSPGTLYPTLAKMVRLGLLTFKCRTVNHKQRKYYRITPDGLAQLERVKSKIVELYEEVVENRGASIKSRSDLIT